MVAVAIPAVFVAVALFFLREPARGATSRKPCSGKLLDDSDDPPVRLTSAGGAAAEGQDLPLPHPRHRRARLRAGQRARAAQLPVRRDLRLLGVQARLGALAHLPPRAARDPDRRPLRRPLFRRDPRNAVRMFGCARDRVRRVPHHRLAARRGRAADRARRHRQRVPARRVHAGRPDDLGGRAVPDARAGVRADRLLHLPARRILRRAHGRGHRRRLRRAHRAARGRARRRADRRAPRAGRAAGS